MGGAAGHKRTAPIEPEEGGGAAKRQRRSEGGLVAKPGNGVPEKEQARGNKRPAPVEPEEGGGAAKRQKRGEESWTQCIPAGDASLC